MGELFNVRPQLNAKMIFQNVKKSTIPQMPINVRSKEMFIFIYFLFDTRFMIYQATSFSLKYDIHILLINLNI